MADIIYLEYTFKVNPLQPASDVLIAELGEIGFESFVETKEGIQAYILKDEWSEERLSEVQVFDFPNVKIEYTSKEIPQENWNATWEENFTPILVDDTCVVRAPFHENPKVKYDIVIEPKMSFGTGHHETTYMMLKHILEHDFAQKSVLDMGSGTGVLAILAGMKGATKVDAIDIDNWCYLNAKENVERNNVKNISVFEGDSSLLTTQKYDIIIANINRNILLADIPTYAKCLHKGGFLFLSGFYTQDLEIITSKCNEVGLKFEKNKEKNNWISAKYVN